MSTRDGALVDLTPCVEDMALAEDLRKLVEALPRPGVVADPCAHEAQTDKALRRYLRAVERASPDHQTAVAVNAAARVLSDLSKVGWSIGISPVARKGKTIISGTRPEISDDRWTRRRQLIAARGEALRRDTTRRFVRELEIDRKWGDRAVSVFSLMRDGRELVASLQNAKEGETPIRPYLQVISGETTCEHTGLRLADVWRYFRLTWTNAPRSIPARQMRFIVRDAACEFHPVIGIGELSGAAIKVGPRDRHIGWDPTALDNWWRDEDPKAFIGWLENTVERARYEVFADDFVAMGVLSGDWDQDCTPETVTALRAVKVEARAEHESGGGEGRQKIDPASMTNDDWEQAARQPLFVSKRAGRLADLMELWQDLAPIRPCDTAEALEEFMRGSPGRRTVARVLRIAKARLQGTAIADVTVCGAVAPYNLLLGGKLVAMLASSPEIIDAYRSRYSGRPSIIASSTAGRAIVRAADLVLLSTTGLYGVRPSQYDRLSMPASVCGGSAQERLRWDYVRRREEGDGGRTAGWGTFQFSSDTVRAIESWLVSSTGRRRVTYQYGEGASPRLRLLREGLSALGLDPTTLLVHGLAKTLYVCSMIRRPHRYLLGLSDSPDYVLDSSADPRECTAQIAEWWTQRWLSKRRSRSDVVTDMKSHTLIRPVVHGARVSLPEVEDEQVPLFESW